MRSARVLLVAALAVSAVASFAGCAGRVRGAEAQRQAPLAAVLVSAKRSEVHLIDLRTGTTVARKRLRSPAYDVAADDEASVFVTAQSGGVGADSDNRLGIVDARGGGRVSYVKLPWANPSQVVAGDGRAFVVHGVAFDGGLRTTTVDVESRAVVATGAVPDGTQVISRAAGATWVSYIPTPSADAPPGKSQAPTSTVLARVEPDGRVAPLVAGMPISGWTAPHPVDEGRVLTAGFRLLGPSLRASSAEVVAADARSGTITQGALLDGLDDGVEGIATFGHSVAIVDGDGSGDFQKPCSVDIYDARTFERRGEISLGKGPVAIAGWGDALLIADATGHVALWREGGTKPEWTTRFEGDPVALDIAVLEAP